MHESSVIVRLLHCESRLAALPMTGWCAFQGAGSLVRVATIDSSDSQDIGAWILELPHYWYGRAYFNLFLSHILHARADHLVNGMAASSWQSCLPWRCLAAFLANPISILHHMLAPRSAKLRKRRTVTAKCDKFVLYKLRVNPALAV